MYWMYALDLISRYLHIACTTVLVGGTLFYEMVVPGAIEELKTEQQLDVFGRARWFFRRLVWTAAALLILSGIFSTRQHWIAYQEEPLNTWNLPPAWSTTTQPAPEMRATQPPDEFPSVLRRPGWWWAAHASTGALAVLIAVYLTTVARPPDHPIGWMRLNLVILLIVIFLATATRHVRLFNADTVRPSSANWVRDRVPPVPYVAPPEEPGAE